jgi:hypothetical protein
VQSIERAFDAPRADAGFGKEELAPRDVALPRREGDAVETVERMAAPAEEEMLARHRHQ